MDEHIPHALRVQLQRLLPETIVLEVGSEGAPALGTLDPDILQWCEANDYILVTNNRKSMPRHLGDHLAANGHIPGVLTIDLSVSIGVLIQELRDIVELSLDDEYQDRIAYVPF